MTSTYHTNQSKFKVQYSVAEKLVANTNAITVGLSLSPLACVLDLDRFAFKRRL
jgi:hypothetical protein